MAPSSNNTADSKASSELYRVTALSSASATWLGEIEAHVASAPWSPALFEGEFLLPHSRTYGVKRESTLVGYVVAHFLPPEAHIMNIGILPQEQGQGLGGLLVDTVINESIRQGVEKIFLEVRASNDRAIRLYESRGFVQYSTRKKYYSDNGEDALMYVVELATINLEHEVVL